jgi:hypothetical protein
MTLDLTPAHAAIEGLQAQHLSQVVAWSTALAESEAKVADLTARLAQVQSRPKPRVHLVAPGDTLTSIAAAYSTPEAPVTVANLVDWNDLTDANAIHVDEVLYLTDGYDEPDPEPEPEPVGQFPGDPGPDKIIVGIDVTHGNIDKLRAREAAIGMKLGNRVFDNGGIGDLAVPNGPVATKIKRDIADGRVPIPSFKPGIENLAAQKFETELVAFFKWYQGVLVAADMWGVAIAHHEPSNDWPSDDNNLPAMAKHKADYGKAQAWLRKCLNKAVGKRSDSRILFAGAFMTYEWSTQGVAKWGSADLLNPGMDPENPTKHVFDLGCGDHYNPDLNATTLERPQLTAFLASMKKWGVQPGLTELGVKTNNPLQATVLKNFLAKAKTLGLRLIVVWDSEAGAGGQVSTDPNTYWTMKPDTVLVYKDFCLTQGANPNA